MERIRLDQFLVRQYPQYTRSQIKQLIEADYVTVNGEIKKASYILKGGEDVHMKRRAPELPVAEAEDIPLNIIYEDEDLLVINKPPGLVVHPAPGHHAGTLVNALLHHIKDLRGVNGELRPGIVHRLDKGTSGLMVVAKHDQSLTGLMRQFKARTVYKIYQTLVFGKLSISKGTIRKAIGRDKDHRRKFSSDTNKSREAVTHYETLKVLGPISYLQIKLETGRTHQIRVHLSEAGHPIVGDVLYGAKSYLSQFKDEAMREKFELISRPILHARELKFIQPMTKKELSFKTELPEDFAEIIRLLS